MWTYQAWEFTLSFNFQDADGNQADTVTRTITVVDTTKPVISLGRFKRDNRIRLSLTGCGATWTDYIDGTGTITATGDVDSSNPGIYTLAYDYQDTSGNLPVRLPAPLS